MTTAFGEDDEIARRFTRRTLVLGLAQVAAFGALSGRLYNLQVLDGGRYAPLADDNRLSLKITAPVRGRILDRAGTVLAANDETFRVLVQPGDEAQTERVIALLSRIVPIAPEMREQLLARSRKGARGSPVAAANDLTFDQVAEINLLAPHLPGVETEIGYVRRYPQGAPLAHVTGYVGAVERRALDDDPVLRMPGLKVGKTGLERGLERELRGEAGTRRLEIDARGRTVRSLDESPPVAGADMVSSIDTPLQRRVMERLSREKRAAAVVMDVASGEVMALASWPTFDAQDVSGQISAAAWKSLVEAEHQPMMNRALSGLYPPGSTFKIVTALAALEAGAVRPGERIRCPGSYTVGNRTWRCWKRHGHGSVDLHEALRESCDVYFYEAAKRTGARAIGAMARKLGFGQGAAVGLALDKAGVVPDADWKRFRLGEGWSTGDSLLTGIGQGFVLATPLQLAVMTARLATGRAVVPTLLHGWARSASEWPGLGVSFEALEAVRRGLVGAVNEPGGTGYAARHAGSVTVAGKTGTSQVRRASDDEDEKSRPWEHRDHALFVGYFPAEAPRYAVAAIVEHGGGGGTAAAPLVKDIVDMLIADDPVRRTTPPAPPPVTKAVSCCARHAGEG